MQIPGVRAADSEFGSSTAHLRVRPTALGCCSVLPPVPSSSCAQKTQGSWVVSPGITQPERGVSYSTKIFLESRLGRGLASFVLLDGWGVLEHGLLHPARSPRISEASPEVSKVPAGSPKSSNPKSDCPGH